MQARRSQGDTGFLEGGGELGAMIRARDWVTTPLGPPASWPRSLKTAVRIMLTSRQPIWIGWGPELTYLYNDPYKSIIGGKHPQALGRPFREVWREIWDVVGPMADVVMQRDEGTYVEAQLLVMERHGYQEETYYTFSYSPIPDDDGGPGGLICANTDDTRRVIGERQLATLHELAAHTADARDAAEACRQSVEALAANTRDVPLALAYVRAGDRESPMLAAASPGTDALHDPRHWPWSDVARTNATTLIELRASGDALPSGAWPRPPTHAAVLPIHASGPIGHAGLLVVGLNPFRPFDESYRGFLELVARQVEAAIANAEAYEHERKRADALARIDEAKTAFFSNVSHEFRTPLTLMLGPIEDALQHADLLPPEDRDRLQLARRNALRLQQLVNTLLDFSRIQAGRVDASFEATDLGPFTAGLASLFRSATERAGLRLVVDCPSLPTVAHVDRTMWEKIVFNLISNAFKFTFEGEIEVRLREQDGRAVLTVRDTGTGIPAHELPRLFERFHRIEHARGRTFEGSGIGLALVREIVELHGGSVEAQSEVDRGSVFTVSIPLGTAHLPLERIGPPRTAAPVGRQGEAFVQQALSWLSPEATEPHRHPRHDPPAARIVLADDNADMREYVRKMLEERYEVEAVADGHAALAAIRARRPDLVITDVMMPVMNGFELLRAVRSDVELQTIPVILLSARAGEDASVQGIAAGADDYVVKPFGARELLARVDARLELSAMARRLEKERDGLHASEARYRHIFEGARVSIWEQDFSAVKSAVDELVASGVGDVRRYVAEHPEFVSRTIDLVRIVDVNDATVRLFRAADKHELLESLHEVFVPESVQLFAEELVAIAEGRPFMEAEVGMRTLQGDPIEVLFTITFPESDPQLRRVLVTLADITARKAAESALREEARTLETLNRVGHTLSAELDLQRIVQTVTDAATEVSGAKFGAFFYNVEDASGARYMLYTLSGAPREAFENFGMPRSTAVFAPTFEGRGTVRMDDVLVDPRYGKNAPHRGMPEGHLPVRSYLAVPVMPRAGEVIGGLFFGHPEPGVFTERHERLVVGIASQAAVAIENARLHEQRLQLIEQLRQTDQRKDEFLATLSHELRNPLAPLRSGLHLLRLETKSGSPAHLLEVMERQVDHLVRLVDDLLEMSRISRGRFELRKERVALETIVSNALETSEAPMAAADHAIEVSLPEGALWIEGDPVRLAQILANLLDNAAKYTARGGRISVRAHREGDAAVISVRDSGCGISPEALPRVFEMFNRGDHSSGRSPGGLGIGLALARQLAQMHGGEVTAHSEGTGAGSEFLVRLPLAPDQSSEATPREQSEEALPRRRILVVDDNRDAADSLGMLLEALGADVRVAVDGPGALEVFASWDAAVILLDIGMPGMDGYEVARRIRSDFPGRRPMIVALTGWGQEDDRRRAREAGFDHHLVKPAELAALRALLASLQ